MYLQLLVAITSLKHLNICRSSSTVFMPQELVREVWLTHYGHISSPYRARDSDELTETPSFLCFRYLISVQMLHLPLKIGMQITIRPFLRIVKKHCLNTESVWKNGKKNCQEIEGQLQKCKWWMGGLCISIRSTSLFWKKQKSRLPVGSRLLATKVNW